MNHGCCIESTFEDGAVSMSLILLPPVAANIWFMEVSNQSLVRLPKMQDQKWLMLNWCSFSGWGRKRIADGFAYKGSNNLIYEWFQPITSKNSKMKVQKSLMFSWLSLSIWFRKRVAICIAVEASPYLISGCLQWMASSVTHDSKPNILDAQLILIYRMGYWQRHGLSVL